MMIYVHFKIAVCSWHKHLLHIMPHFTYCTYKSYTEYIRSYDFVPNKLALKPSGLSSCSSFQWWFCPNAYFLKGWRPQNMATPKDLWLWPGKKSWCLMRKVTWLVNPWGSPDDLKPYGWLRLSLPFGNFEVLYLDEEVPFLRFSKKGPQSPIPWCLIQENRLVSCWFIFFKPACSIIVQHGKPHQPIRGWMDGRTESPAC